MSKYGTNWGDVVKVGDKEYVRTDLRHPKLKGLEGKRVEITFPPGKAVDWRGEVARYQIGQTTGPHVNSLLLHNRRSRGGDLIRADWPIESVRVIE